MNITWITQGGFVFEHGSQRLVVDPYFSGCLTQGHTHLVAPPLSLEQLKPSAVLCTHDHADHLDPKGVPELARHYPNCRFIGPRSVVAHLLKLGVSADRIQDIREGSVVTVGDLEITVTRAYHSEPHAVGLVLAAGGRKVYLSGDSEFDPQLAPAVIRLAGGPIDLALICINGKWGNMSWQQARDVIRAIRPAMTVPMHYGLFAENTVDPEPFVQACRNEGIPARTLKIGQPVSLDELLAGRD